MYKELLFQGELKEKGITASQRKKKRREPVGPWGQEVIAKQKSLDRKNPPTPPRKTLWSVSGGMQKLPKPKHSKPNSVRGQRGMRKNRNESPDDNRSAANEVFSNKIKPQRRYTTMRKSRSKIGRTKN
jgi:hypothetical protein